MSDFYTPPEGWDNPTKLSNGTIRKFIVRWEDRVGKLAEKEVEAENFHEARVKAMGIHIYNHEMVRSTIFEKVPPFPQPRSE